MMREEVLEWMRGQGRVEWISVAREGGGGGEECVLDLVEDAGGVGCEYCGVGELGFWWCLVL